MQPTEINLGNIDAASAAPGRWYWETGILYLNADNDIANPDNQHINFVLVGAKTRWSYDLSFHQSLGVTIEFGDPMELAMRLCAEELTNADMVVRRVKEAIGKLSGE